MDIADALCMFFDCPCCEWFYFSFEEIGWLSYSIIFVFHVNIIPNVTIVIIW